MSTPDDPAGDGFLRVAHMGHVNAHMTLGALAVMEAGMLALDIAHGPGALAAAAAVVAGCQGVTARVPPAIRSSI
jgi:alanine-glyoxylate transaminase/serine-glyoxylate transaminase/serine-pyruvate transaminase